MTFKMSRDLCCKAQQSKSVIPIILCICKINVNSNDWWVGLKIKIGWAKNIGTEIFHIILFLCLFFEGTPKLQPKAALPCFRPC